MHLTHIYHDANVHIYDSRKEKVMYLIYTLIMGIPFFIIVVMPLIKMITG
jgi:hypothetical protein